MLKWYIHKELNGPSLFLPILYTQELSENHFRLYKWVVKKLREIPGVWILITF
jgi:hypothetical protein